MTGTQIFVLVTFALNVFFNFTVFVIGENEDKIKYFNAFLGWSMAFLYAFAFFGAQ